jgi:purine-binding chemotaxis protein CheW
MTLDSRNAALLVRLGDRRFGLPLASVERVLPMARVLPLPEADASLLGVLNLRGNVLPVIDAHARLGVARPQLSADHRLVLLNHTSEFLMWVDAVEDVVALDRNGASGVPLPAASSRVVASVVRLGDEIVPLLDASALEPHIARA